MQWIRGSYLISDDPALLDLDHMTRCLDGTYWAGGRERETVLRSVQNSATLLLRHEDRQVGFARLIGDQVTMAYLSDVYVDQEHRGRGLGKWLVECCLEHPAAQVEKIILATSDAHGLYERYGFIRREMMLLPKWLARGMTMEKLTGSKKQD